MGFFQNPHVLIKGEIFMKKVEVAEKVRKYKEKLVSLQMKLAVIEKKCDYRDEEHFGFYKVMIESSIEDLDFQIFALETSLDNLMGYVESEKLLEEVQYSETFMKPKIKEINELFEEAVK